MGRPSRSRALDVWANGLLVGRWRIPTTGPMEFRYDAAWMDAPEGRPLSLSLPMALDGSSLRGDAVASYFENLLPDADALRRRIQSRFHTRSTDAFDLLEAVGRDCIGAIQLVAADAVPEPITRIEARTLSEEAIERHLLASSHSPTAYGNDAYSDDDFRLSLAGAQEKTALTWHRGRWCLPRGTTPTTHIFKLPLGIVGGRRLDLRHSVENEWLCAQILAAFDVPVAGCSLAHFGETKALVVERFDRQLHASKRYFLRLAQEDFCQATATPSAAKYEADGGPGLVEIARILHASVRREADLTTLLRAQLLFFLLAATDGHAKNFSLRLLAGGRYHLTPLYDVLSAWPIAGSGAGQIHPSKLKLAMAVHGERKHYVQKSFRRRHFDETARRCGLGSSMTRVIDQVLGNLVTVLDAVEAGLPAGFPGVVFERIAQGMKRTASDFS